MAVRDENDVICQVVDADTHRILLPILPEEPGNGRPRMNFVDLLIYLDENRAHTSAATELMRLASPGFLPAKEAQKRKVASRKLRHCP